MVNQDEPTASNPRQQHFQDPELSLSSSSNKQSSTDRTTTATCVPIGSACVTDRCRMDSNTTNNCNNTNDCSDNHAGTSTTTCVPLCYADSPCPVPSHAPVSEPLDKIRKLVAEAMGTCLLIVVVVGSGIQAEALSTDVGLQLWINAFATSAGLYGLITVLGPISGAHFNPCVSLVDVWNKDMQVGDMILYVMAQTSGGCVGTILANVMFKVTTSISEKERWGYNLWISEIIATASLIWVIHGCIRTGNEGQVPTVVALWVGGGYFFTSSSIFGNPAVTIARMLTNTFAGIEPQSAGLYIVFQYIGTLLGWLLVRFFYQKRPHTTAQQDDVLYQRACLLVHRDFFQKKTY